MISLLLLIGCPAPEKDTDGADTGDTGVDTADTADAGTPTLAPGFTDDLTESTGCADVMAAAYDTGDTVAIVIEAFDLGVATMACLSGGPESAVVTLPDPEVDLRVDVGAYVTHYVCNDAIEYEPVIERAWTPTTAR